MNWPALNKICCTLLYFFFPGVFSCMGNEQWPKATYDKVHDSLKAHDLVHLFHSKQVDIKYRSAVEVTHTIHEKSMIFSKKGLGYHPEFLIPDLDQLHFIKARTIKPDGTVIELKKAHVKTDKYENGVALCRFAFPGTAPGDQVEFLVSYTVKKNYSLRDQFFHLRYPVLKSDFSVHADPDLKIETKSYNGAPAAVSKTDRSGSSFTWEAFMVPPGDEPGRVAYLEKPFVRVVVRTRKLPNGTIKEVEHNTWSDFRKDFRFNKYVGNYLSYDKKLGAFVTRHLGAETDHLPDSLKLQKLVSVITFINDSIDLYEEPEENGEERLLGEELELRRLPGYSLFSLYSILIEISHFDNYLCLGRARFLGPLDSQFVSNNQVSNYFMAFKAEGKMHYIFPPEGRLNYNLDEIPVELQGSVAVFFRKKGTASSTRLLPLPLTTQNGNTRSINTFAYADIGSDSISERSKLVTTGAWSSGYRNGIRALQGDSMSRADIYRTLFNADGTGVDSLRIEKNSEAPPFVFTVVFAKKEAWLLKSLESRLKYITLDKILGHILPDSTESEATLAKELFPFVDNVRYHLLFDRDVQLLNQPKVLPDKKNATRGLEVNIQQVDARTISIISRLTLDVSEIKKGELALLNRELEDAKSKHLVVKVVD